MKKLISLLLILFGTYYVLQFVVKIFDSGHDIIYYVNTENNSFKINEIYSKNVSGSQDNYYFEIQTKKGIFDFQTYDNYWNSDELIKSVYYFDDNNYECLLPVFNNNKTVSDIICKKDNKLFNYQNIKGEDTVLDNFVNDKLKKIYNENKFKNNEEILKTEDNFNLFKNLAKNNYLVFENYKGVYTVNKSNQSGIANVPLFFSDVYKKTAHIVQGKYYITIDYSKDYNFNDFIVVNIMNGQKTTITSSDVISNNCYFEGVVGNDVYLFDRSNKIQYKINVNEKSISVSGNVEEGINYYDNGTWSKKSAYNAADDDIIFNNYQVSNIFNDIEYYKVDKVGTKTGYYYLYKKVANNYYVYRASIRNPKNIMYLFQTGNINKIIYNKGFIYYIDSDKVYYYSDNTGVRLLAQNSELNFNTSLIYGVYIK